MCCALCLCLPLKVKPFSLFLPNKLVKVTKENKLKQLKI